jgi:hypothetical protein
MTGSANRKLTKSRTASGPTRVEATPGMTRREFVATGLVLAGHVVPTSRAGLEEPPGSESRVRLAGAGDTAGDELSPCWPGPFPPMTRPL